MDDLISRRAALDIVFDFAETPDKMYQQIRELPGIGWVSCNERLPDKAGRYLTTCSKWGTWKVDWNIWVTERKPQWLWEQGVIAWMPLPEPYKEEIDD